MYTHNLVKFPRLIIDINLLVQKIKKVGPSKFQNQIYRSHPSRIYGWMDNDFFVCLYCPTTGQRPSPQTLAPTLVKTYILGKINPK